MDLQSRLEGHRGGPDPKELLRKAALRFQQAAMYDPNYPTALVNLACVHILMNEYLDGKYYCTKAKILADSANDPVALANAKVVEALIAASEGDQRELKNNSAPWQKKAIIGLRPILISFPVNHWLRLDETIPATLPGIKAPATSPAAGTQEEIDGFNIYGESFDLQFDQVNMGTANLMVSSLDHSTFIYYPLPNNEGLIISSYR